MQALGALAALGLLSGSMGPKAEAAPRFVRDTGGTAAIDALADAAGMLAGKAGTRAVFERRRFHRARHIGAAA